MQAGEAVEKTLLRSVLRGEKFQCNGRRRVDQKVFCFQIGVDDVLPLISEAAASLVESRRTDVGPRQHIVAYLGELNSDLERRWQRTVVFYNRQGDARQLRLFPDDDDVALPDDPDVVRVRLRNVGWTNARSFGDVWLARWLWHYLGLDDIVARHPAFVSPLGLPAR